MSSGSQQETSDIENSLHPNRPEFWQARYTANQLPWDLGEGTPPLSLWLQQTSQPFPGSKILIPGAGVGHDAAMVAHLGYKVTAVDFASGAIAQAQERYPNLFETVQADIFQLPSQWHQTFDGVLEHTCFCAISPKRRLEYAKAMFHVLKPGGRLVGLFWEHGDWGGPPYRTDLQDLHTHFDGGFTFDVVEKAQNSVASRQGEEWIVSLIRKDGWH